MKLTFAQAFQQPRLAQGRAAPSKGIHGMRLFGRANRLAEAGPIESNGITVVLEHSAPDTLISVAGRVSKESSPCLRSLLLQTLRRPHSAVVVVDLARVTSMDSSGLATFLEMLPLARQNSVKLRLVGVCGQPRTLAEMIDLPAAYLGAGSEVVFR